MEEGPDTVPSFKDMARHTSAAEKSAGEENKPDVVLLGIFKLSSPTPSKSIRLSTNAISVLHFSAARLQCYFTFIIY